MSGTKVVHQQSRRLTPSITLHTFHTSEASSFLWHPGDSLRMQLPTDIDLTTSSLSSDPSSRQVVFTPCAVRIICSREGDKDEETIWQIDFILRNSRLSTLIGTPRKPSLTAVVENYASGFQDFETIALSATTNLVAIAGGTGICSYLALSPMLSKLNNVESVRRVLLWSIHYNDLVFVKYVLDAGHLCPDQWSDIGIFVTSGTDPCHQNEDALSLQIEKVRSGLPAGSGSKLHFVRGRMKQEDLTNATVNMNDSPGHSIFFCGGKAFQWQIKRWCLPRKISVKTIQQPVDAASQK